MRLHLDLFSGIGGFALAARAAGVRTVQFVEFDARCRAFLAKAWPGVPIHDDVRTFSVAHREERRFRADGSASWSERHADERHPIYLLTAGVPCQPASRAGKQRGAEDDRWLWPDAIRILSEVRPTWALFENPPGIGDVGLAGILADVEAQGYEVRVFDIPACAVSAPHRRARFYIVAHRNDERAGRLKEHAAEQGAPRTEPVRCAARGRRDGKGNIVAHASEAGREGPDAAPGANGLCAEHPQGVADTQEIAGERRPGPVHSRPGRERWDSDSYGAGVWDSHVWLPCADGKFRRAPDDSQRMAHGLPVELLEELGAEGRLTPEDCHVHRSILGALGNSIVPQVAAEIIKAMVKADEQG